MEEEVPEFMKEKVEKVSVKRALFDLGMLMWGVASTAVIVSQVDSYIPAEYRATAMYAILWGLLVNFLVTCVIVIWHNFLNKDPQKSTRKKFAPFHWILTGTAIIFLGVIPSVASHTGWFMISGISFGYGSVYKFYEYCQQIELMTQQEQYRKERGKHE